jgi:hypothetical protein
MDEIDLLSRLKAAEPLRPQAFQEARAELRAAMATEVVPATTTAPRRRARWSTRRTAGFSLAALGAAAAAVALVFTSVSPPSHTPGAGSKLRTNRGPAAPNSVLVRLAADITARSATVPGNATMEIRNQSPTSNQPGANGIDLYTDSGIYYWGFNRSNLRYAIAQHQDVGEGQFKRAIAAALIAANGDVATGRARMAVANFIPGIKPSKVYPQAARKALIEKLKAVDNKRHVKYTPPKRLTPAQQKEQTDNLMWMNSFDALIAAPDNAKVRAGVLAIMATMPDVKVRHTITAGQPTLTLSDTWPLLDSSGYVESLVINASTGFPVAQLGNTPGHPLHVIYYHTHRVTLANVEAGRFKL